MLCMIDIDSPFSPPPFIPLVLAFLGGKRMRSRVRKIRRRMYVQYIKAHVRKKETRERWGRRGNKLKLEQRRRRTEEIEGKGEDKQEKIKIIRKI